MIFRLISSLGEGSVNFIMETAPMHCMLAGQPTKVVKQFINGDARKDAIKNLLRDPYNGVESWTYKDFISKGYITNAQTSGMASSALLGIFREYMNTLRPHYHAGKFSWSTDAAGWDVNALHYNWFGEYLISYFFYYIVMT